MRRKILLSAIPAALLLAAGLYFVLRSIPGEESSDRRAELDRKFGGGPEGPKALPRPEGEQKARPKPTPAEGPPSPEDPRPVSLFGRVADPEGRAIAGARILALHASSWRKSMEGLQGPEGMEGRLSEFLDRFSALVEKERGRLPRAESGEDGAYAFRGLAAGEYLVFAAHGEFIPERDLSAAVREGEPTRLDIRLIPGCAIAGRAIDAQGRPIAGARISADPAYRGAPRGLGRILDALADASVGLRLLEAGRGETDAEGLFRIGGLEPIPHDLSARKDGFVGTRAWNVPVPTEGVILVLEEGSALSGRVVGPGGVPIGGAELALILQRDASGSANPLSTLFGEGADPFAREDLRGRSGEGGHFRIAGVRADAYLLRVEAEGFAPLEQRVVANGSPLSLGDIVLAPGRRIAGMVCAADGTPVAGARVWVPSPAKGGMLEFFGLSGEERALAAAKTDDAGHFALDGLPEGRFEVKASAEGHGEGLASDIEAGARGIEILLRAAKRIAGFVRDAADGSPIAGAKVVSYGTQVETDTDGGFVLALSASSIALLGDGRRILVIATHPDYDQTSEMIEVSEEGFAQTEIRLRRAGRITGKVLDADGRPVEGARVRLSVPGLPASLLALSLEGERYWVLSGPDGTFSLRAPGAPNILQKKIGIAAAHPAHGVGRVGPLPVPEEGMAWPEVAIMLGQGSIIEGTVRDSAGSPIRGARIHAAASLGPETDPVLRLVFSLPSSEGKTAYSDGDGRYRIEGLLEGRYDIQVDAGTFATKRLEGIELGRGIHPIDIVLDSGKRIEGRVLDAEGSPIAGAEVTAFLEIEESARSGDHFERAVRRVQREMGLGGTARCRTAPDGRFAIADLPDGAFAVVARSKGFEAGVRGPVRPGDPPFDIVLLRHGAIRGTATDARTGLPLSSFQVRLSPETRSEGDDSFGRDAMMAWMPRRFDDSEGRFRVEDIPPGRYLLDVSAAGYAPFRVRVRVRPGEETRALASLEPGRRLEGIVLDAATGAPIEGVRVRAVRIDEENDVERFSLADLARPEVRTDASGAFALEGLGEGEYHIHAEHPLYTLEGSAPIFRVSGDEAPRVEIRMKPAGRLAGSIKNLPALDRKDVVFSVAIARIGGPDEAKEGKERPSEESWRDEQAIREDGSFTFDAIPPGRYRVAFSRIDFEALRASPEEPPHPPWIPLGEVEIRSGETTKLEFFAP